MGGKQSDSDEAGIRALIELRGAQIQLLQEEGTEEFHIEATFRCSGESSEGVLRYKVVADTSSGAPETLWFLPIGLTFPTQAKGLKEALRNAGIETASTGQDAHVSLEGLEGRVRMRMSLTEDTAAPGEVEVCREGEDHPAGAWVIPSTARRHPIDRGVKIRTTRKVQLLVDERTFDGVEAVLDVYFGIRGWGIKELNVNLLAFRVDADRKDREQLVGALNGLGLPSARLPQSNSEALADKVRQLLRRFLGVKTDVGSTVFALKGPVGAKLSTQSRIEGHTYTGFLPDRISLARIKRGVRDERYQYLQQTCESDGGPLGLTRFTYEVAPPLLPDSLDRSACVERIRQFLRGSDPLLAAQAPVLAGEGALTELLPELREIIADPQDQYGVHLDAMWAVARMKDASSADVLALHISRAADLSRFELAVKALYAISPAKAEERLCQAISGGTFAEAAGKLLDVVRKGTASQ